MRKCIATLAFIGALLPCTVYAEPDTIRCVEEDTRIFCTLSISDFINKVRPILTNGWENTFQIYIELLTSDGAKVLQRSKLEASQRCYLDPFESPCLILWRGAKTWQRYRDENAFLIAMSRFAIQALTLTDLPSDNYIIRISLQVTASVQKRLESIRSWFRVGFSDSGMFNTSSGSLVGAFVGSKAEEVDDDSMSQSIVLKTSPFYIDLNNDFEDAM